MTRNKVENVDDLIRQLSLNKDKTERSKGLAEYFTNSLFNIENDKFMCQYVDGGDDGGIDFYNIKGNTFYIIQSKFEESPTKTSETDILHELMKINNALKGINPNKRADEFVNELRRSLTDDSMLLEVLWLTTNVVEDNVKETIIQELEEIKKTNNWKIGLDLAFFDKNGLERLIFDVNHGYTPPTGRKTLKIDASNIIKDTGEATGVFSVTCNIDVNDLLKWFSSLEQVDSFLQKNIRGYLGENVVNSGIQKSYEKESDWFWYKHNGVIIFADQVIVKKVENELILHNPQIVNGGQTIKSLYDIFNKHGKADNPARVLLRAYRLPYESEKTYAKSIEIINGLNSQNKILPSDLCSNDMRQVRVEQLLKYLKYIYYRRREKRKNRASRYGIPMPKLAFLYYECKKQVPFEGVRGQVEELFESKNKYNEIFNEQEINKPLSSKHIALKYVTAWNLYQVIRELRNDLNNTDYAYFEYTQHFVLTATYKRLFEWKSSKFKLSWKDWPEFTQSQEFKRGVGLFAKPAFKIGREIIPETTGKEKRKKERDFYRSRKSFELFEAAVGKVKFDPWINDAYQYYCSEVTS